MSSSLLLEESMPEAFLPRNTFPVKTRQTAFTINDTFTEFLYQQYSDLTVLHISQLNKPGTIIRAERDTASSSQQQSYVDYETGDDDNETYTIQVLLGKRSPSLDSENSNPNMIQVEYLLARQIIEKVTKSALPIISSLPMLLCISIDKKFEQEIQSRSSTGKKLMKAIVALTLQILSSK